MNKISLSFFTFFICGFCFSQHYNFTPYTVDDGLSQSQVTAIDQDSNGYLWVGTTSGLSRFNGVEFKNYSISNGLTDNGIQEILVDGKKVWIATRKGLSKFENGKFEPYYFDQDKRVNDLLKTNNRLLIATDSGLYVLKDKNFHRLGDATTEVKTRSIVAFHDKVFVGTPSGLRELVGESLVKPYPFHDTLNWNISGLEANDSSVFLSTYGSGVVKLDPVSGGYQNYINRPENIRDISLSDQYVIASAKRGIVIKSISDELYLNSENGLESKQIKCSFRDSEGNVWIGTDGGGLLKYVSNAIISYGVRDGLSSNAVMSINEIDDSYLFGTYNAGLTIYGNEMKRLNARNGVIDDRIWCVETIANKIYLGTDNGVTIIDSNFNSSNLVNKGLDHKIRAILGVGDAIYFGGVKGLFKLNSGILTEIETTSGLNINKITEQDNQLFIAAKTGLYSLGKGKELVSIPLPVNDVNTVAIDSRGYLWVGTTDGLLVYFDQNLVPIELDQNEFKSRNILGLLEGEDSTIWVSTAHGVYNLKQVEGKKRVKIFRYGKVEGLVDLECNLNALYEDKSAHIWVGTSSGLCRIDPEKSEDLFSLDPPILQFTNLRLFLEDFDFDKYSNDTDSASNFLSEIILPYNKNHLTFDFNGINLKDPNSVQYKYRLIGLDDEWVPLQKDNYATYSFISPGEYIFEVRAANKNLGWSDKLKMQVVIKAPFWKTWWFILLMILVAIAILLLLFRVRIKALEREQKTEKLEFKNRLQLLEQRSLNASMNRHFIFNSLNSIQFYINSSDKRSANKYLTSFAKLIRMNLDSSVQHNFIITLEEEIERIELYLNLEKMRFKEKFEFKLEIEDGIDKEGVEIPSMILQPFVENALIHGILPLNQVGNILIKIFEVSGELNFQVTDDGIGIKNSLKNKKEEPIGDHESQGVRITERRIEVLRRITGDQLSITGPEQIEDASGNSLGTRVTIKMPMDLSQNM